MRKPPRDTLWDAVTPPGPATGPPQGDIAVDVAVVGAGFTGLSAALALARAGVSVAVLEAGEIAAAASGRNAGFVVPHFSRADPARLTRLLPPHHAEALLSLVEGGGDRVFALARELGLGPQAQESGWLQPAHGADAAEALRARVGMWQARGRPVEWLTPAAIAERTGMSCYHGALADASGGVVNPLALARGLGRLALEAGASIHTRTPVEAARAEGGVWRLVAGGRQVLADRLLLATNAGTGGAAGRLGRTVVPLQVYQIATEPLDRETVDRIAPARQPVSDTRTDIFTYRLDEDDRLISGGMALLPVAAEGRMARRIAARLAAELRLGAVPRVDFVWRGTAAMTRSGLPALVAFGHGGFGAIGCNGRGVAFTVSLGDALGRWLAAGGDPSIAPLPLAPERPVRFRGPGRLAPSVILMRGRLADRRAMRTGPADKAQPAE